MVSYIKDEENKIFEIKVEGKVTREDFKNCVEPLDAMIKKFGKVKILEEIVSFTGMEVGMVWDGLKFDLKHWKSFTHCAIVTDKKWIESFTKLAAPMTGIEIKFYHLDQLSEARKWLQES